MMLNRDTPRRRLAVDLSELEYAFEDASWEASRYLDLETGQVITITLTFRPFLLTRYQLAQMAERRQIQGLASVAECVVAVARVR
jgi:hypothetical protein